MRLVARKVYTHKVKGAAVVYDADGDGTDFAAPIGGGAPVSLWTQNQGYGPDQGVNAIGTAFARKTDGTEGYGVEPGSLVVVPLTSGRPRLVVDATKEGAGWNSVGLRGASGWRSRIIHWGTSTCSRLPWCRRTARRARRCRRLVSAG